MISETRVIAVPRVPPHPHSERNGDFDTRRSHPGFLRTAEKRMTGDPSLRSAPALPVSTVPSVARPG